MPCTHGDLPLRTHRRTVSHDPGPTASAFVSRGGEAVRILGSGRQRLDPIYVADVVEAIVRATLDLSAPTGTWELAGPRTMTMDEFARELNHG